MNIKLPDGLLVPARYVPSGHCDFRPDNMQIDLIVVHGISLPPGEFGTAAIEQFFLWSIGCDSTSLFFDDCHIASVLTFINCTNG